MRQRLTFLFLLGLGTATSLAAQQSQRGTGSAPAVSASSAVRSDDKRAMTVADYALWRSIRDVSLSNDGTWASFGYQQRKVDDSLFLKNFTTGAEVKVARGSRPQFSDDSKWVAYIVSLPEKEIEQARAARRPTPAKLELRNLATGATVSWDNVESFAFAKGSAALIIHKARPDAAAPPAGGRGGAGGGRGAAPAAPRTEGTDLILRHLAEGSDELIGSVAEAEFNKPGTLLAYTVASADRDGNGLYVVSTTNWSHRTLDNAHADYSRLTWDSTGTAVAALRGMDRRGFVERENAIVAVTGLDASTPVTYELGREQLTGLPDSMVVSEKGTLTWSPDHSKLFVGLKEQAHRPRRDSTEAETPVGNVDVWHWKDPYIQSVQMVRAQRDRNRTLLATVLLGQKRIVPLADDHMDTMQLTRDGAWAIGSDDTPYIDDTHPAYSDIYRVNTTTGERTPIVKDLERTFGVSPDGKYFLYWKGDQVYAYDIAANTSTDITKTAPVSFVDAEDDHIGDKPAYGVSGYTADGKSVILEHRYDLWAVPLDGRGAARDLTNGEGTKNAIRFRIVPMDADAAPAFGGGGGGARGGRAARAFDLSKPVILSAYGDLTKKAGFYRLDAGRLTPLVYGDFEFGTPVKAKNADRVILTRETYVDFPDYYVTNSRFENATRFTNANPQQAQFKWGHRILVDYTDKDGHKLQGTLAIPDDYKPGEKRPMLVYFYEKLSQNQNHYEVPRYASAPQYVDYVSNGYLVLLPDVYYHTGRSHTDMLNSVEAAVKRVEDLGYADPKRVGLHGGSYSGQGGAYISTQSKMFAAIAIRAAAVDLISDFDQLWKTTGTNQHNYDMYGQGRFGSNPFDNPQLFMDQSALFHAKTMDTPLLIFQGTNDGSTEWLQGVEFYNALRFLHKPVIFLSYEGEGHGFTRYDNQYDVEVRMHQFFDHYLKDAPAAEWIANGVPFLKKQQPTGEAAEPVQLMGGGAGIGTPNPGAAAGAGGTNPRPGGSPPNP